MIKAKDILKECMKNIIIIPNGIGIYFLIKNGVIVYVGQSTKVFQRIDCHRNDHNKDFDTACYFECPKEDLDVFERVLIRAFAPVYNTVHNPSFEPYYFQKPSKSDKELSEAICKRLAAGKYGANTKKAFKLLSYTFPDLTEL